MLVPYIIAGISFTKRNACKDHKKLVSCCTEDHFNFNVIHFEKHCAGESCKRLKLGRKDLVEVRV